MNKNILILNTGGTFNKIYDEINGNLIVPKCNDALHEILENSKITNCAIEGLVYKDSLEITKEDRDILLEKILNVPFEKIIIIHGTDTMDKTANFLAKYVKNKTIILTGAMVPFSLDKIEATANLMQAVGYLNHTKKHNVYISMHGYVKKYNKIIKNRTLGIFECQK